MHTFFFSYIIFLILCLLPSLNPFIISCILQRMGAVFPQRSDSAPVLTPPQTQPLSSYPQNLRITEPGQDAAESSAEPEFPTLRYTDTARLFLAFAKTNSSKLFSPKSSYSSSYLNCSFPACFFLPV